jgi:hypothetical protein
MGAFRSGRRPQFVRTPVRSSTDEQREPGFSSRKQ